MHISDHSSSQKRQDIIEFKDKILYSDRYSDNDWEYRHVTIAKELIKYIPKDTLLNETQWRELGIQQSLGWVHYMIHKPEPHVLMFRREKDYQIKYPNGKPEDVASYNEASSYLKLHQQ